MKTEIKDGHLTWRLEWREYPKHGKPCDGCGEKLCYPYYTKKVDGVLRRLCPDCDKKEREGEEGGTMEKKTERTERGDGR